MKIYKIKVNGKVYEVELESVEENDKSINDNDSQTPKTSSNKNSISSPMQGTIQNILVKPGQKVKKGDSLLVIETMKLENIITADNDYLVLDILVKEGDSVDNNQPLLRVE